MLLVIHLMSNTYSFVAEWSVSREIVNLAFVRGGVKLLTYQVLYNKLLQMDRST